MIFKCGKYINGKRLDPAIVYIEAESQDKASEAFGRGRYYVNSETIDFYIDEAESVPDNVTVVKASEVRLGQALEGLN